MRFDSPEYLVFLAVVALTTRVIPFHRRVPFLLVVSFVYFGSLSLNSVPILVFSILLNYATGIYVQEGRRPYLFFLVLAVNFLMLGLFKYVPDFSKHFFQSVEQNALFGTKVYIPIGISFFTFQASGYLIDVYKGTIPSRIGLSKFALFIAAFPQLVAGPIERARDFGSQLDRLPDVSAKDVSEGVARILQGLVRKLVIADGLASVSRSTYVNSQSSWLLYLSTALFAFQIYNDFAGYCDIAVGSGRLLGFRMSENFAVPFRARSLSIFWRYWHGTLHSWLKDYIYLPLLRQTKVPKALAQVTVFAFSGAWHGNSLNYLLMGFYFGGALILLRIIQNSSPYLQFMKIAPKAFEPILVFHFFLGGLLIFRSPDWQTLSRCLKTLVNHWQWTPEIWDVLAFSTPLLALSALLDLFTLRAKIATRWPIQISLQASYLAALFFFQNGVGKDFIYYVF